MCHGATLRTNFWNGQKKQEIVNGKHIVFILYNSNHFFFVTAKTDTREYVYRTESMNISNGEN